MELHHLGIFFAFFDIKRIRKRIAASYALEQLLILYIKF